MAPQTNNPTDRAPIPNVDTEVVFDLPSETPEKPVSEQGLGSLLAFPHEDAKKATMGTKKDGEEKKDE